MTEQKDALAEAKQNYIDAEKFYIREAGQGDVSSLVAIASMRLQFAQTAALIAIAEALTKDD